MIHDKRKLTFLDHILKIACTSSGNLQQYIRTHSGENPFQCNKCRKAYKDKRSLMSHLKIRVGHAVADPCGSCG